MYPHPPSHLSPSARQWWETTVETYLLEPHHVKLLQLACEAWDRCQAAREQLDREGMTVPGREGGVRPHPAISVERDARLSCARLIRELDLDTAPSPDVVDNTRPPTLFSNRGRHARKDQSS
jgi:P27 family predicted phage terminase small subunit